MSNSIKGCNSLSNSLFKLVCSYLVKARTSGTFRSSDCKQSKVWYSVYLQPDGFWFTRTAVITWLNPILSLENVCNIWCRNITLKCRGRNCKLPDFVNNERETTGNKELLTTNPAGLLLIHCPEWLFYTLPTLSLYFFGRVLVAGLDCCCLLMFCVVIELVAVIVLGVILYYKSLIIVYSYQLKSM